MKKIVILQQDNSTSKDVTPREREDDRVGERERLQMNFIK